MRVYSMRLTKKAADKAQRYIKLDGGVYEKTTKDSGATWTASIHNFLQEQLIDEANRNPSRNTLEATLTIK